VGEEVVVDDEVGRPFLRDEVSRDLAPELATQDTMAPCRRGLGERGRSLDDQAADAALVQEAREVTAVARDLDDTSARPRRRGARPSGPRSGLPTPG
jgi:hypothetical protein